jgi:D-glycero-D-manno-heptose 1,7-bisphosphate phosphatase
VRAILLDRDGVLNRERGFVTTTGELEVMPGVGEALQRFKHLGYLCLVLTNQSGLARGLLGWRELNHIHRRLRELLPGLLDAFYVCPHHPTEGSSVLTRECPCRKPQAALFRQAVREHGLQLTECLSIGDAPRDIEAAAACGLRSLCILGVKVPAPDVYPEGAPRPVAFVPDLLQAAAWIEDQERA